MVTKPSNSAQIERDIAFGQRVMITTTPDADYKENTDYFIGVLRIAHRRRRISIHTYNQISIRSQRISGAKTEKEKILTGESRAHLYIFEFTDGFCICTLAAIKYCLVLERYEMKVNHDGETSAVYIKLKDIPHLFIPKDGNNHIKQ